MSRHRHIDLTVPDREIAVTRGSTLHTVAKDLDEEEWTKQLDVEGMRKDLGLVIKEAFDVARRQIQDQLCRHDDDVPLQRGSAMSGFC